MRKAVLFAAMMLAAPLAVVSHADTPTTANLPTPTLLAATLKTKAVAPGKPFKLTFHWQAVPLSKDYSVMVHFVNEAGAFLFQDDHQPPTSTTKWTGPVSYVRTVVVPPTITEGNYKIMAGLYAALPDGGGWENRKLEAGKGVISAPGNSYQIGTIEVNRNAPSMPLDSARPVTLNLKGYKLTFQDEFNDLSVSAAGPGTRWTAHTPYNGDFGDAGFANPEAGFPFTIQNGMLRIEARKEGEKWRAGLLSSVDPQAKGFSQTYGYFEMRAKFPKGPGTWPAFWLLSVEKLKHPETTGLEVDIVEQYGVAPQSLHATLHWWPGKGGIHEAAAQHLIVQDMTEGFHNYGFLWDEKKMVWYFDGVELWRQPTPAQGHTPLYVLVNLAMGGGWPIQDTPNPSFMDVDYVRVYALPQTKTQP